jgi:nucleoside-diphosphate-sugar epimerase
MNVFITGGSGYIGQATVKALVEAGHEVEALARSDRASERVSEAGATPVAGGLTDLDVLRKAAERADGVIHLAQADSADADLAAASAMLEGVGRGTYVHTSGTWVYGDTDGVVDETAPWNPPSLVAWRQAVEEKVLQWADQGGHPVIVRPGLLYGGTNPLIDAFYTSPARETGEVSYIGDGSNHWSLVHIEDLARLYVAALKAQPGSVYVGVGGVSPTAKDAALALSRSLGLGGDVVSITLEQAREQMGPIADAFALDQQLTSARAQRDLGWIPAHTDPLGVLTGG